MSSVISKIVTFLESDIFLVLYLCSGTAALNLVKMVHTSGEGGAWHR